MNIFRRIGNAMVRFMYGRNGMDQLNRALFFAYLFFWVAGSIAAAVLKSQLLSTLVNIIMWVLMVVIFVRMFSKNLPKRRAENQKWINWWWRVKNNAAGAKARHADKDHKYFTCKACKTICRVPAGKGKIIITCPKCGAKIEGKS